MAIQSHPKLFMVIDPVHIGTGGMRLGQVDNTIVREPGTKLPKIPGTSLSGAARQYAARTFGNKIQCAGSENHCGLPSCPICYTFGFVKGQSATKAQAGTVSISDARILLFPVYSMIGPVWITAPMTLKDSGIKDCVAPSDDSKGIWNAGLSGKNFINVGWLMLTKDPDKTPPDLNSGIPKEIAERVVIVTDRIFSQIVNSNLEVRTSVSIDPETGAARDKALFTYEAIPRSTILWTEIVEDDFLERFPSRKQLDEWSTELKKKEEREKIFKLWGMDNSEENGQEILKSIESDKKRFKELGARQQWESPLNVVDTGFDLMEHLGIGGMGTRGFGRIKILAEN